MDTEEFIKTIEFRKTLIFRTDSNIIYKGTTSNVKSVRIRLHYNVLGLSFLTLTFTSNVKFDNEQKDVTSTVQLSQFTTSKDFHNLLDMEESTANAMLSRYVDEYEFKKRQYRIFET